jgi:hypothetical protein
MKTESAATGPPKRRSSLLRVLIAGVTSLLLLILFSLLWVSAIGVWNRAMDTCAMPPPGQMSFSFDWRQAGLEWEWVPPRWTCIYWNDAGQVVRETRLDLQDVF